MSTLATVPSARVKSAGCVAFGSNDVLQRAASATAFCSTSTSSGFGVIADSLIRPPVLSRTHASRARLPSSLLRSVTSTPAP